MKTIKHTNLVPKPIRRAGMLRTFENHQGTYNADVTPKASIRIYGVCTNHIRGAQNFDRVFSIGDEAEYGSYNLKYTGKIVAIGPKTVTIKHYDRSPEVTRLDVYEFVDRNWDFDAVKIAKDNAETMQCL